MIKEYYNKKTLILLLEEKTGIKITYNKVWELEKKGVIKPVGIYMNGKQKRPIYNDATLNALIKKVNKANKKVSL